MGGGVCLGSHCFLRAEQEPPLRQTAHLWGRGSQMAGSTFQVPTSSGVGRKCETWRLFPTSSTIVPLHLGSSAPICSACLPSVTLFLDHISPVSILWKQELFKSKGDGSGTDDREVMEPPSLEVKKQLARQDVRGGGSLDQMPQWEQNSFRVLFSRTCFHHTPRLQTSFSTFAQQTY